MCACVKEYECARVTSLCVCLSQVKDIFEVSTGSTKELLFNNGFQVEIPCGDSLVAVKEFCS